MVFENICGAVDVSLSDEEKIVQSMIYGLITASEGLSAEQIKSTKEALEILRTGRVLRPDTTWTNLLEAVMQIVEYIHGPIEKGESSGR
jgi:hypothetical protein